MTAIHGTLSPYMEGEDWDDYVERMDQYFIANDVDDADGKGKKRAVFLSVIGSKTYGLIKTLLAPDKPVSKTYKELVELVRQHISPKPIVIAERYKFYNRKQRPGESIAQYIAELRKLSEHCEFGVFLQEALRDMFVIGLKDVSIQKKLLSERNLDLKTAYGKAISHEMADHNVEEMHGHQGTVHKVVMSSKPNVRPKPNRDKNKQCYRCGRDNHAAENCFFKDKECHLCHRKGHISAQCSKSDNLDRPSFRERKGQEGNKKNHKYGKRHMEKRVNKIGIRSDNEQQSEISSEDTDNDVQYLNHIRFVSDNKNKLYKEIMLKVYINEKTFSMELDTGATVTVINYNQKQELLPNVPMLSPDAYLNTFTEERVKVVGKCYVDVFYNGQLRQDLPLYVVEGNRPALFGRNWVAHLGLDSKDLNKLCKINKVIINRPKDLTDMLKEYDVQ